MKSSDLVLFRDICDSLDDSLYQTIQNPDNEFIEDIESGYKFSEYSSKGIEYDFDDMEDKLRVSLRYYQRLALYFTKYYFEKKYLLNGNQNNKLTYWMATGSGKTIIMKANIIDYFEYLRDKNPSEIEVIITSPLKELIGQLRNEMSEFFAHEFFKDFKFSYKIETTQGLIERYKNESHEIVGESQYRLLLVDEAHIGLGNDKSGQGAFVNIRNELTKNISNSFMFEYSATFYDLTDKKQIEEYANRIIYEYDYGKFYNDRYGKDFKFDVIKKDEIAEDENKDIKRNLDANLEAFNQKLKSFNDYNSNKMLNRGKPFPNRPLLVMAGNTVSASKESSANNEENSDISKIIDYLANLDSATIDKYIAIFNENKGVLHLLQNSSNNGELLMSFGEDALPFGLITVGNIKKFLENNNIQKLIADSKIITKNIKFTNENYLFKNIDYESSPINILIGSRKFSAGWNSFRVSQICLINFGTGSGPTIIQMFGRGVRLRGLNDDGKRSERRYVKENESKSEFLSHSKDNNLKEEKYELLKYLETLFIYSLRSTYLSKFVEQDTDIYKKSIVFSKGVEVSQDYKEKSLPIFYIDKSVDKIQGIIKVEALIVNDAKLNISYEVESIKNNTIIDLPITIDLSIKQEKTVDFKDIGWLESFVDRAYIQKLIYKKQEQNSINIAGLSIEFIIDLLISKNIIIKYDGEIKTPLQFQKITIKAVNILISKIKNKIIYNENKQNYKYDQTITSDDYIDRYDIKFVLDKSADAKKVSDRLESRDNFKIFIDKVFNHYYQPLALDPHASTQKVYETYQKCLDRGYTQNYKNILDSDIGYFEDIEEVKISPDRLNPDEFKFVCDLQKYISEHQLDVTILRNKSKGNIGLIADDDSGVFYPDFILWYMQKLDNDDIQQHIIFCDPKGIRNAETKWKVCDAPYYIKELEKKWDSDIKLHSFIVSNTSKKDIVWSPIKDLNIKQCDLFFNLVFMDDSGYIEKIFKGINYDILIHKEYNER
ncbi:MAG: DEAD/DEAH box helicase family protein [Epsilonproteobacteria bacterium]|nr:DEAD/DEAH box helicase family protein [Campylobacterota bacterium]